MVEVTLDRGYVRGEQRSSESDVAVRGTDETLRHLQPFGDSETGVVLEIPHEGDNDERAQGDLPSDALYRSFDAGDVMLGEYVIEPLAVHPERKRCDCNVIKAHNK